ncbi:TonB-dependent hemoglobin/transferrin/lactoferrin family receptor [Inquilinus limosus]|uniref:TonB-dependent hemoglobin/transferrin/lactoferrin family receptor n=1 Tax=Inquilinus limosus TaxID=171674 RepID=UPI0009DE6C20|nr:TonB-dependent hemoglobin/transferrin/lactoferrin family receptor [Inquilinus limosus]
MVGRYRGALRLGVALGALSLGGGFALAQSTPETAAPTAPAPAGTTLQLAPIAVTGAKVEDQPAWTDSTDRQELDQRFVRSWTDLGRRVDAGINFNRQNDSINIRGLDGDRVLTMIDGIRLPYLDDGARNVRGGLRSFDFDTLSRIDVVRGADSSRYGSGALGGVLALRTFDPEDLIADGRDFGGIAKFGYQGDDDSVGGTAAVAGRIATDTTLMLQGGFRIGHELDNRGNIGGFGADRTRPNPDDYDQQSLLVKLAHRFEGGHRLSFTGEYFRRQDNLDIRTDQGPGQSYLIGHDDGLERSERKRASIDYDYTAPKSGGFLDRAHLTAYWLQTERVDGNDGLRGVDSRAGIIKGDPFQYGYPSGRYSRKNRIEQTLWGVNGEAERTVDLAGLANRLTVGGEYYHIGVEQYSGGFDNCPTTPTTRPAIFGPRLCGFLHSNQADMPEVRGNTVGLYAEDEIAMLDGRVKLTPGLRFDWYELNPHETAAYRDNPNVSGLPSSSSDSALSPKVAVSWQALDEVTFYAQWAKGFKAPTATQLYLNYGGPGTYLSLGNPDLKPETSSGYEIGARLGDDDLGGSITWFDNWYRNFIDSVSVDPASVGVPSGSYPLGVTSYENRARVRIYGIEAAAHWRFGDGWRSWASLAWAVGRDEGAEVYLNSVPPLRAIVGLGYDSTSWGADASLTMATRRDKVEEETQFKAPGYAIVDLTGWWEPERLNGVRIQAGVFNLFDRKYYDALNIPDSPTQPLRYYTEPGRSVRLNLTYRF